MLSTMSGSIIGGAIAAAIGGLVALGIEIWREHRRKKIIRKSMIEELMAEIEENIRLSSERMPGAFEVSVWKNSLTKLCFPPAELLAVIRKAYRKAEQRNRFLESVAGMQEPTIGTQEIQNGFMLCRDMLQKWMDSNIK